MAPFFAPSFFAPSYFEGPFPSSPAAMGEEGGGFFAPSFFAPSFFALPYFAGPSPAAQLPPIRPFVLDLVAFLQSTLPGSGIYPEEIPETGAVFPAVVYTVVDGDDFTLLSGQSGLTAESYQLDVYSPDYGDCQVTAEAIRRALQGYRGMMGQADVENVNRKRRMTGYEDPVDASDLGKYRFMAEYLIFYRTA